VLHGRGLGRAASRSRAVVLLVQAPRELAAARELLDVRALAGHEDALGVPLLVRAHPVLVAWEHEDPGLVARVEALLDHAHQVSLTFALHQDVDGDLAEGGPEVCRNDGFLVDLV